ncbi:hypothetical protein D3C72_1534270 [compost metagenome]
MRDFLAHQAQELLLQRRQVCRQGLQLAHADHADFGVLQRGGIGGMLHLAQPVETDNFAGQVEAGNLRAAVFSGDVGLERAKAHGIDRGERIAHAIQGFTLVHTDAFLNQRVHLGEVLLRHADRKAQLPHRTGGAAW